MQCDWYISAVIRPKGSQQNTFHPMQGANSLSLLKVYSQSALQNTVQKVTKPVCKMICIP